MKSARCFQSLLITGAAALILALTSCASPANREAMVPQSIDTAARTHPYSVHVQTGGGAETSGLDSSNIADADLKAAIEDAITRNKVFRSVVQGKDGDYELSVRVSKLTKPLIGLSFTVEMDAAWTLIKASDHTVVLRKAVHSTGTATPGEAFAGVTRLRLAVEAAARDNISQGLQAIAALQL